MKAPPDRFFSELDLVSTLTAWLVADGYRVKHEVGNMGQSADLVATKGRWITVFEAKIVDWQRALNQCQAHEVVADFICIAIASAAVSATLESVVRSKGYGLAHFDRGPKTWQWVIRPTRNPRIWRPQRRVWSDNVRRIEHAH